MQKHTPAIEHSRTYKAADNNQSFKSFRVLKYQLRSSQMSLLDQCLLWATFTLSFYDFLCASECLSLVWSDITLYNDYISIILRQSKTDPFWKGQSPVKNRPLSERTIYSHICHLNNDMSSKQCITSNLINLYSRQAHFHPCHFHDLPQYCINYYLRQTCAHPITHHTASGLGQTSQQQQLG